MRPTWIIGCAAAVAALAATGSGQFEVGRVVGHDAQAFASAADIDGEIAVVGVREHDGAYTDSGAAYVFVRVEGNWIEEAKLVPSDPTAGGYFGNSVAIEGNRVVVGASRNNGNAPQSGAAYVFRRTGVFPFAAWTQQAKLQASDGVSDQFFGWSIAMSGNTVVVGALGTSGGAAYVYLASGSSWTEQTKLALQPAVPGFGNSVSVDGDTAVIGQTSSTPPYGAAHVYERIGSSWSSTATLTPQSPTDSWFGFSVAVSGDTALVGSPLYDHSLPSYPNSGAVFAFFRSSGTWSPSLLVEPAVPTDGGWFGWDVAIEAPTAVIAMPNDGTGGIAYAFEMQAGASSELGQLRPRPSGLTFVDSGSLAISGNLVIADSVIFSLVPPAPVAYCTAKVNSLGCTPTMTFQGEASATTASPFLLGATNVLSHKFGLLFFGVSGRTSFPFQGGTLCVLPPIRRSVTQDSGGTPGDEDCTGFYSFDFNAFVQSGVYPDLVAGVLVDCQYWSRDPASLSTTGLTNAVEFGIGF